MDSALHVIALAAAIVAAIVPFVVGWRLSWRHFQLFMHRRDNYRLSAARYALKRIRFALGGGVIFGGIAGIAAYVVVAVVGHQVLVEPNGPVVDPVSTVGPATDIAGKKNAEAKERSRSERPALVKAPFTASVQPSVQTKEKPSQESVAKLSCLQIREDVMRLEMEKQYSGDDEIVRERLGLPARPSC